METLTRALLQWAVTELAVARQDLVDAPGEHSFIDGQIYQFEDLVKKLTKILEEFSRPKLEALLAWADNRLEELTSEAEGIDEGDEGYLGNEVDYGYIQGQAQTLEDLTVEISNILGTL